MGTILRVADLKRYFKSPKGTIKAVDGVSFAITRGKTLGVVGESGCGKSTLGRTILNLCPPSAGEVWFQDKNIAGIKGKGLTELHRDMQMIFQDPYSSLNPRMSVSEIIAEPFIIYRLCRNNEEIHERVLQLMDTVGLAKRLEDVYPHELDGGRRQRIGIARALALEPMLIVCDEPVSALDVSVQAQILNLMQDLQESKKLTYIFITHDLSVVRHISDDILVMYLGTIVEKSATDELFKTQYHPYTQALLSAIFLPTLGPKKARILLQGEIPSPINLGQGCRFAGRCVHATRICVEKEPTLEEISPGHFVACLRAREIADNQQ